MTASIYIVKSPDLREPEAFGTKRAAVWYARGFKSATVERKEISPTLRGAELYARLYNRKQWANIVSETVFDSATVTA